MKSSLASQSIQEGLMPVFVTLLKSGKDQSDDSTGNRVHSKLHCMDANINIHNMCK